MHIAKVFLPCLIGITLSTAASAEIYQSKDAQGNTVYSDMPSKGAEAVKVSPTNSANPVVEAPRPPPSPQTPDTSATPRKSAPKPASSIDRESDDDYLYYGDNYDHDAADNQIRREQRRDENNVAKPKTERPHVEHHRNVSRSAGGGGGRR